MKCLYCGSESTEINAVLKEGHKTIWIVECNSCASVSRIVGTPLKAAADDDDEKEYAAPDENWQWQPPES